MATKKMLYSKLLLSFLILISLTTSCAFFEALGFGSGPADLQSAQTQSKGYITVTSSFAPTKMVRNITQNVFFDCTTICEFKITSVTLDLTAINGLLINLKSATTANKSWSTNLTLTPTTLGSFTVTITASNENKGVTNKYYTVQVVDQTEVCVSTTGNDSYEGLAEFPMRTINAAISRAETKSINKIYIAEGTYTNHTAIMGKCIDLQGKNNLNIYGGWNSSFTVRNINTYFTVIDGKTNTEHIVYFLYSTNITLNGLWLTGGINANPGGGGIYSLYSVLNIQNCIISNNHSLKDGAGIYVKNSEITLLSNNFSFNTANLSGGGIYFENSVISIDNCTVYSNRAINTGGGGIYMTAITSMTLQNSYINKNYSERKGGGFYIVNPGSSVLIKNTVISSNISQEEQGGGIYIYATTTAYSNSPSIINNTISSNSVLSANNAYRGGAIALNGFANPIIISNTFDNNNKNNISEYDNPNADPAELKYNRFINMSSYYFDKDKNDTINTISELNSLDENGFNPVNSVEGNTNI